MSVARETVEVIKCDIDSRPDAQPWELAPQGQALMEIDICDRCRKTKSLEEIYAHARPASRRRRRPSTSSSAPRHRIEPVD